MLLESRPPFSGELMHCCMCGREEKSDRRKETAWRMIEADDERFYFCPRHFPSDDSSSHAFQRAYTAAMERIQQIRVERRMLRTLPGVWRNDVFAMLRCAWPKLQGSAPEEIADGMVNALMSKKAQFGLPGFDGDEAIVDRVMRTVALDLVKEFITSQAST